MQLSLCRLFLPAALAGLLSLITSAPAEAQGPPGGFRIKDEGKFFSQQALDKAEGVIAAIKRETKKDVLIETYPAIPEGLRERFKKEGEEKFFGAWVRQRAEKEKAVGVAILICRDPEYLRIETDRRTERHDFTDANRLELSTILIDYFKKKEYDTGLQAGLSYIKGKLETNAGVSGAATTAAPGPTGGKHNQKEGGLMDNGILGWVCLGVGVLLALWLVVGLFRAFSGAGRPVDRPPGNYAGNYGQGGYGPAPAGGGGFMSSMLGGMLGAGAGMWAYDTFFRGGSSGPSMTPPAYGGGTPVGGSDPQPGGTDGGSFGSSAPADAGGGGDWGGDGGAGGGGDWGGGDAGAGGGGDWGGGDAGGGDAGGGGDWGGGGGDAGGDWGGGGGGGDW